MAVVIPLLATMRIAPIPIQNDKVHSSEKRYITLYIKFLESFQQETEKVAYTSQKQGV